MIQKSPTDPGGVAQFCHPFRYTDPTDSPPEVCALLRPRLLSATSGLKTPSTKSSIAERKAERQPLGVTSNDSASCQTRGNGQNGKARRLFAPVSSFGVLLTGPPGASPSGEQFEPASADRSPHRPERRIQSPPNQDLPAPDVILQTAS